MSKDQFTDNDAENDPERTLITLDQLSQTIEVMTSVVNRLRKHLSEQLKSKIAEQSAQENLSATAGENPQKPTAEAASTNTDNQIKVSDKVTGGVSQQAAQKRESFVVEITQQEVESNRKSNKVLH